MPVGNLILPITDLRKQPIGGQVTVEVRRDRGANGAGGGDFDFTVEPDGASVILLNGIPTRGGSGSLHSIRITARNYLPCAFQQFITEGEQRSIQKAYLTRDAKRVAAIDAPSYGKLPDRLHDWLGEARMIALASEDEDLVGKSGEALYDALGDRRKAALLNIFAKATHKGSVGAIWKFFRRPLVIRRDRCFVEMEAGIEEQVSEDNRFVAAPPRCISRFPLPHLEQREERRPSREHPAYVPAQRRRRTRGRRGTSTSRPVSRTGGKCCATISRGSARTPMPSMNFSWRPIWRRIRWIPVTTW